MTIQNKNIIKISDEYGIGANDMNTSEKSATAVDNDVDKLYASVLEVVKHIRETS